MTKTKSPIGIVLVCVVFLCTGLVLSYLSNPRWYTLDPKYDSVILVLAFTGFAFSIFGILLLLQAASRTTESMPPDKRSKANIGVGIGFILQFTGFVFIESTMVDDQVGLLLLLAGFPVLIWGCLNYAEGKRLSKWTGLLALLSVFGLIVLILLPEQKQRAI